MITAVEESKNNVFSSDSATKTGTSLLDSSSLPNGKDTRIAILRKVRYKTTKDGKPYISANFEDVNGYIIIGRMFDFVDLNRIGEAFNKMVGNLVKVTFNTDYFNGSVYLALEELALVPEIVAAQLASFFVGKFNMAEERLRQCNTLLASRGFTEALSEYRSTYCNLNVLTTFSDETISNGLRGALIDIVHKTLTACPNVSNETILAFLSVVLTWVYTRQELDSSVDENAMFFTASLAEKILMCKSKGMLALANKLTELSCMFTNTGKIISADTYLIYSIYKAFVENSTIAVIESHLPADGFCAYKNFTLRRS